MALNCSNSGNFEQLALKGLKRCRSEAVSSNSPVETMDQQPDASIGLDEPPASTATVTEPLYASVKKFNRNSRILTTSLSAPTMTKSDQSSDYRELVIAY